MFIRSQDKLRFVNLDRCHLAISRDNCIVATDSISVIPLELLNGIIGKFSSKEKALKVLDTIQKEYLKSVSGNSFSEDETPSFFQIPLDNEVEL